MLVLANKTEHPLAIDIKEIKSRLSFQEILDTGRECIMVATTITDGTGMGFAMNWLMSRIKRDIGHESWASLLFG